MDTMQAFAMGQANRGKELMVFDWDKAAQLIKESGTKEAFAGLSGDWGATGGCIFEEGIPVDADEYYCYLASTWATPELEIDEGKVPCFKMQSETDGWHSGTMWPDSAVKILEA